MLLVQRSIIREPLRRMVPMACHDMSVDGHFSGRAGVIEDRLESKAEVHEDIMLYQETV
jgi:hypothetical protein